MRTMHPSKPVTAAQTVMSDRHKANRAKVDDKPKTPDNLRRALAYDKLHGHEHLESAKDIEKELKKAAKDNEKERKK